MNILFVCTANICRSAMAEGILKKLLTTSKYKQSISVTSAGIEALVSCNPDRKTIEACREHDINVSTHSARQVTKQILLESDLVLCMQKIHQQRIISAYPQFTQIVFLLKEYRHEGPSGDPDIYDPTGKSKKNYQNCFTEIEKEIIRITPGIIQLLDIQ